MHHGSRLTSVKILGSFKFWNSLTSSLILYLFKWQRGQQHVNLRTRPETTSLFQRLEVGRVEIKVSYTENGMKSELFMKLDLKTSQLLRSEGICNPRFNRHQAGITNPWRAMCESFVSILISV